MSYQGFNVRSAFIPRPGRYFLDVDYKQIEFRKSAMVAFELEVLKGFAEGKDYYKILTALMLKIRYDDVTKQQRQQGKIICLGQNYGQEKFGLARTMKIPVDEAEKLMTDFWAGQPNTKQAKEQALQEAQATGYVQTWFGRKRQIPELRSSDRKMRGHGVRSVWSHKIQGSCADIIKIAMLRADKALEGRDAFMILTVHDELLFEVSEKEDFHGINQIVKEAMEFIIPGYDKLQEAMRRAGYPDWRPFMPTDFEFGYDYGNLMPEKEFLEKFGDRLNLQRGTRPTEISELIPEHREIEVPIPKPIQEHKGSSKKINQMMNISGIGHVLSLCGLGEAPGLVSTEPQIDTQKAMNAVPVFADVPRETPGLTDQKLDPFLEGIINKVPENPVFKAAVSEGGSLQIENHSTEISGFPKGVFWAPLDIAASIKPPAKITKEQTDVALANDETLTGAMVLAVQSEIQATVRRIEQLAEQPNGTLCEVCRKPQFMSPAGITCPEGHGGADSIIQEEPLKVPEKPKASPMSMIMAMNTAANLIKESNAQNSTLKAPAQVDQVTVAVPISNGKHQIPTSSEFKYPCLIAKIPGDLEEKHVTFLQALCKKFQGTHLLYIGYHNQMIECGDSWKVNPTQDFMNYFKRCCGDNCQFDLYDISGKPQKAKVNFA